jgi:hypothetical protein
MGNFKRAIEHIRKILKKEVAALRNDLFPARFYAILSTIDLLKCIWYKIFASRQHTVFVQIESHPTFLDEYCLFLQETTRKWETLSCRRCFSGLSSPSDETLAIGDARTIG